VCIPGHTGVLGTLTLTQTTVTTLPAGQVELAGAGTRVHGDGLADDQAIADELADGLARVGVGDLVHLIGVEPNLALAAADHGGGEALLGGKVDPVVKDPVSITQITKLSPSIVKEISGCPREVGCNSKVCSTRVLLKFPITGAGDGTHILMSALTVVGG
jgi:hypothetical protein